MNKCQHCGVFVPAEKAFCPNCSEPMEAEERPNRAHSFSSDNLMATIRDDPEKYRQVLMPPVKQQQQTPPAEAALKQPAPDPARVAPSIPGFSYPDAASIPPPPAKSGNKSSLILGISAVVIVVLVLVLLFAFKVI